jgi:hypothetical protein
VERTLLAADAEGVRVAVPRPGERVEAGPTSSLDPWWRS